MKVENCIKFEADLIKELKKKFKQRTDYGKEYFEGNINDIISNTISSKSKNDNEKENVEIINSLKLEIEKLNREIEENERTKQILFRIKNRTLNDITDLTNYIYSCISEI